MSSTSNSQSLLVNVFRPAYVYSPTTGFVPKLAMSNVDVVATGSIQTANFQLGDGVGNVYVGCNAGGPSNVSNASNTALGNGAASNCSNTQGTVAIGFNAFANIGGSSNSVGIGTNTSGGGISNVVVGANSGTAGQNMIVLGCGLTPDSSVSNRMYIGTGSMSNITLTGDLSNRRVGINTTTPQTTLDVSGDVYIRDWVGVGVDTPQAAVHANGSIYATTGFAAQDGSAIAPVYSFMNDASTGIHKSLNGGIGFAVGGSTRMAIDSTSNSIAGNTTVDGIVRAFGFGTYRGTASNVAAGGTATVAELMQKGMILISTQQVGSTNDYTSEFVYVRDATGAAAPDVTPLGHSGNAYVTFSGSNIQISNGGGSPQNFNWSVTYFPLQ